MLKSTCILTTSKHNISWLLPQFFITRDKGIKTQNTSIPKVYFSKVKNGNFKIKLRD